MFDSFYIVSYIIILVMLSDLYYTHLLFTWPCMFISHNHTIYLLALVVLWSITVGDSYSWSLSLPRSQQL